VHEWHLDSPLDQKTGSGSADQLERISYVLGIFDGLHRVLGDTAVADAWVNQPNRDFGGHTPLALMLNGTVADLVFVRDYVDRWVGGQ
jgi:hypothetical protein